jgi:hypothetical protein
MALETVVSVGIFCFILMYFTFQLSEDHFFLKLINIFFSLIGLVLLPYATSTGTNFVPIFMRVAYGYFTIFLIYILVYLLYHWAKKSEEFIKLVNKFTGGDRQ